MQIGNIVWFVPGKRLRASLYAKKIQKNTSNLPPKISRLKSRICAKPSTRVRLVCSLLCGTVESPFEPSCYGSANLRTRARREIYKKKRAKTLKKRLLTWPLLSLLLSPLLNVFSSSELLDIVFILCIYIVLVHSGKLQNGRSDQPSTFCYVRRLRRSIRGTHTKQPWSCRRERKAAARARKDKQAPSRSTQPDWAEVKGGGNSRHFSWKKSPQTSKRLEEHCRSRCL